MRRTLIHATLITAHLLGGLAGLATCNTAHADGYGGGSHTSHTYDTAPAAAAPSIATEMDAHDMGAHDVGAHDGAGRADIDPTLFQTRSHGHP